MRKTDEEIAAEERRAFIGCPRPEDENYSADCRHCLAGREHTEDEHDASVARATERDHGTGDYLNDHYSQEYPSLEEMDA